MFGERIECLVYIKMFSLNMEDLCVNIELSQVDLFSLSSGHDEWLMFYGHFSAHDRLNGMSDLQR